MDVSTPDVSVGDFMKILYAIQGTGNGHLSRARDIIPILQQKGDVDLLISGTQADVRLPYPIKFQLKGLGFVFGKKGGVHLLKTFRQANSRRFLGEIVRLPVRDYDLIINDFEPVSAWAARLRGVPCIGLSHQLAVMDKHSPQPDVYDPVGRYILRHYAPITAGYGFHFFRYAPTIFTPVIRRELRQIAVTNEGHFTVYLPAYEDKRIYAILSRIKSVEWQVFSKHNRKARREGNVWIRPVNNEAFLASMAACAGILCGAGFETPAEALYLRKKLLVVPMKNQFEQHCNAASLRQMGVPVIKSLKKKHLPGIRTWVEEGAILEVDYPDTTEDIVAMILEKHGKERSGPTLQRTGTEP